MTAGTLLVQFDLMEANADAIRALEPDLLSQVVRLEIAVHIVSRRGGLMTAGASPHRCTRRWA
jgi:hypothetical protein